MKNLKKILKQLSNTEIVERLDEDVVESKPTDDGYESPDENKVKEECENLEINTIQDITAEDNNNITEEIKYDNADIITKDETTPNVDFSKNMELIEDFKSEPTKNEIDLLSPKVLKIETDIPEPKPNIPDPNIPEPNIPEPDMSDPLFTQNKQEENTPEKAEPDVKDIEEIKPSEDPIKSEEDIIKPVEPPEEPDIKDVSMKKDKKDSTIKSIKVIKSNDLENISEDKVETPVTETKTMEELKSPLKEIISVEKNNDDNETIDDFFNDVNALMKEKGLGEEKTVEKYTLFDDADENE